MPSERIYAEVRGGYIIIRWVFDNCIWRKTRCSKKGILKTLKLLDQINNGRESDQITRQIIFHMREINKEDEIPKDFYPGEERIQPTIRNFSQLNFERFIK